MGNVMGFECGGEGLVEVSYLQPQGQRGKKRRKEENNDDLTICLSKTERERSRKSKEKVHSSRGYN